MMSVRCLHPKITVAKGFVNFSLLCTATTQCFTFNSAVMLLAKDRDFSLSGYSYVDTGVTLNGRTSVTFQVRTAKDAYVRLTDKREVYSTDNMYEIVLGAGANTYNAVRQVHAITVIN